MRIPIRYIEAPKIPLFQTYSIACSLPTRTISRDKSKKREA